MVVSPDPVWQGAHGPMRQDYSLLSLFFFSPSLLAGGSSNQYNCSLSLLLASHHIRQMRIMGFTNLCATIYYNLPLDW
ncbi:hypothetical protein ACN38_g4351 [Penicillium nordicum]|uniref:Uncharacterized protein n=1 Tax=Penicillium nordicum TaxID=229535 RepID=A0A0M8PCA9_9EURO|nr:hypothetical protein ACN38_g4351 [Penicillium nordicum]